MPKRAPTRTILDRWLVDDVAALGLSREQAQAAVEMVLQAVLHDIGGMRPAKVTRRTGTGLEVAAVLLRVEYGLGRVRGTTRAALD